MRTHKIRRSSSDVSKVSTLRKKLTNSNAAERENKPLLQKSKSDSGDSILLRKRVNPFGCDPPSNSSPRKRRSVLNLTDGNCVSVSADTSFSGPSWLNNIDTEAPLDSTNESKLIEELNSVDKQLVSWIKFNLLYGVLL